METCARADRPADDAVQTVVPRLNDRSAHRTTVARVRSVALALGSERQSQPEFGAIELGGLVPFRFDGIDQPVQVDESLGLDLGSH